MATSRPKKTAEPSPKQASASKRLIDAYVQKFRVVDARLIRLPQPLRLCLRCAFLVLFCSVSIVLLVSVALVLLLAWLVYGLGWAFLFGKRKTTVWLTLLAVGFLVGLVMSFFYQSEDNERLAWAWGKLAFGCGGLGMAWGVIAWFRNPTFYPDAAKGYAVGQVLNNQREIREELRDISDHLNH